LSGAWVNADGDFGSPQFINWNWPLQNSSGSFDIPTGWQLNPRNWAVITATENIVETAEQYAGSVSIDEIQAPTANANPAEVAWHFFLPSLDSGYMYYGAVLDHPVIQTVACNNAVKWANMLITQHPSSDDLTPPTVWAPQRLPWNPGGFGMGSLWHYQYTPMPRDFFVWTFVYDVSGVDHVSLYYRTDDDGMNPISDHANELYEPENFGLSGVSNWTVVAMNERDFPQGNIFNWGGINFFNMTPAAIANEYWFEVSGLSSVLVDYYIEAVDINGNVKKSDIQHVFVQ